MPDEEKRHGQPSGTEADTARSVETEAELRQRAQQEKQRREYKPEPKLSQDKVQLKPGKPDDIQLVSTEAVALITSVRQDLELRETVEHYREIKPYEAISDLRVKDSATPPVTRKDLNRLKAHDSPKQKTSWKREIDEDRDRPVTNVPCDNENFALVLPVPIANKLAEFRTIEPETMVFLQEKFDYLQDRVPRSELARVAKDKTVNSMDAASQHALNEMKPHRKDPTREQRAKEQIEVIQQEIEYCYYLPRIHEYCIAISRCDCRDGHFIFWACEIVGYEKRFHYEPRIERVIRRERLQNDRDDREFDDVDR